MKTAWSIVVVYGTEEERARVMRVCDHLVERLWTACEFTVSWWSCEMLDQPELASVAAAKAAEGDLLLFALPAEEPLPMSLVGWVESWLERRGERDGALVDLTNGACQAEQAAGETHVYLRQVAHRGGMDYLTQEPETISWSFPGSAESYNVRAHQVTSLLDDILKTQRVPPQLSQL